MRLRSILLSAVAIGLPPIALAQELPPGPSTRTSMLMQDESFRYVVGDKLKITFFERVPGAGPSDDKPLTGMVERPELSSEYVVQQSGDIFLPLIGAVRVAGMTPQSLQEALSKGLESQTSGSARVSIVLVEREPIYVTGRVGKPGPLKHIPGMTVMHAMAMTAVPDAGSSDYWRQLDVTRERERAAKALERLKKVIARVDVLKSERNSNSVINPSNELIDVAGGTAQAVELIKAEQIYRAVERTQKTQKLTSVEVLTTTAKTELQVIREKFSQAEEGLKEKIRRLNEANGFKQRGGITPMAYDVIMSDYLESRQKYQDVRTALVQAERRIVELDQQRLGMTVDAMFEREREIKDAEKVIQEEQVTRTTVAAMLMNLPSVAFEKKSDNLKKVVIRRGGGGGTQRIAANDDTELEPGDVLLVVPAGDPGLVQALHN
jgi:polysaccharide biosynthesis/export protein ExoF